MLFTNTWNNWMVVQHLHGSINTIEYVTISTTGNAADFGDLSEQWNSYHGGACSNAIRGLDRGGIINK